MTAARRIRIRCPECQRFYAVNRDGSIHRHRAPGNLFPCRIVHESELPGGGEPEPGHRDRAAWEAQFGGEPKRNV